MADEVDHANMHVELDLQLRIAEATRPRGPGLAECEECDEPISEFRQMLGARRCVYCQQVHEHHEKQRMRR